VSRIPIRLRLTGWYAVVLMAVLVAMGTFVVTKLRSDLTEEIDRGLRPAATQIAQGYRAEGPPEFRDVTATVLPGPQEGSGAQVLDPAGRVLISTGDPRARRPLVGRSALGAALRGRRVVTSIRAGSPSLHLRAVALSTSRGGARRVVVATESLENADDAVHRVLVLLALGGAGALALVVLGGAWIAHRALDPVERMTGRAGAIGPGDLSARIAVPRARDQLSHLAGTLNAMLARLEAGVRARERLVADASHELRAPLAAMRSELEVSLRQDELGPAARAVLESAREEIIRLSRIVENLLTLARVDEGRLELLREPTDLGACAGRAVQSRRAAAEAQGVELRAEGGPVLVDADRERLDQVLANLVDNAVRHSPAGGEVRVSVWARDGSAGATVADGGPGVPVAARERIFERFARADPARGRSGGAGLGLAICAEIAHAHGGDISVGDNEPQGARFVLTLPRGPVREARS
jgi:heavy metal sensor kinase